MIILPIDIVGLAQRNGMSQTVQGEVRIDTGSKALDERLVRKSRLKSVEFGVK